jgi:hypothetical protein
MEKKNVIRKLVDGGLLYSERIGLTPEEKECTIKKFFRFEDLAEKDRVRGIKKGYLKPSARTYKCRYCIGWHITNNKRKLW